MSVTELGKRLVDRRQAITAMEAEWFEWLVEFDNHCDWTLDGHANCVSWLVDHCGMAATFSSEIPAARAPLQCWENTNWLPIAHPTRVWASSRRSGRSSRRSPA